MAARISAKRWIAANPERAAANAKRWKELNPERVAANHKRWKMANREHIVAYRKQWVNAHPGYNKKKTKQMAATLKAIVISELGKKCVCCNITDSRFLSVDHINGGGNLDRKFHEYKSSWWWVFILGFPADRFQILCYNCNIAKGVHWNVCPHELDRRARRKRDNT